MQLDHVLVAVGDLAAAAAELEAAHGLVSVEGGRHPGWGTANRIVPLGDAYLELVAVVDVDEAETSTFGRWVGAGAGTGRPLGWAVRTADLDAVAARLGLGITAGSRIAPDGSTLAWRSAGLETSAADPSLPFFLEWTTGTFPGRSAPARAAGIVRLVLRGDPELLARRLGPHELPIRVEPGAPGVRAVVLAGARGEIVIGSLG